LLAREKIAPLEWRAPSKDNAESRGDVCADNGAGVIESDEHDRHAVAFISSRILAVRPWSGRSNG
jgi:hypothetical protein